MFPLIRTVLHRDDIIVGGTIIPIKDCSYQGKHPKTMGHVQVFRI